MADHNTICATEQQIWHIKLSDWLNFNRKFLVRLEIASTTGKQLNISIHSAITLSDLVWKILLKQLLTTCRRDLISDSLVKRTNFTARKHESSHYLVQPIVKNALKSVDPYKLARDAVIEHAITKKLQFLRRSPDLRRGFAKVPSPLDFGPLRPLECPQSAYAKFRNCS